MKLEYQNLVIRCAEADDAEILCRWWNDGAVMAHAGFPNGLGTSVEKIQKDLQTDSDETRRRLVVEFQGRPIGEMCYRNEGNGSADIDIKICESDYQERGLGRLLLSMLIAHLFRSGYEKIVLDTDLQNTRAQHVYEKLGFRKTAVNVDSWKDQIGNLRSSVSYELLPTDFRDFTKRTAEEMWAAYIAEHPEAAGAEYEAWAYGDTPDELARLTLEGIKTATASAYILYELENEPIPEAGAYSVILWEDGSAACVIKTTKVYVTPYKNVSAEQAHKEGEGDRGLSYWRKVHEEFFCKELQSVGIEFSEEMGVVCEEFEVVFK